MWWSKLRKFCNHPGLTRLLCIDLSAPTTCTHAVSSYILIFPIVGVRGEGGERERMMTLFLTSSLSLSHESLGCLQSQPWQSVFQPQKSEKLFLWFSPSTFKLAYMLYAGSMDSKGLTQLPPQSRHSLLWRITVYFDERTIVFLFATCFPRVCSLTATYPPTHPSTQCPRDSLAGPMAFLFSPTATSCVVRSLVLCIECWWLPCLPLAIGNGLFSFCP